MELNVWFWITFFLAVIFGLWNGSTSPEEPNRYARWGASLFLWLLILFLGIEVFNGPVK